MLSNRTRSWAAPAALFAVGVALVAGCNTEEREGVPENVGKTTAMTFEEFERTVYRHPETGMYLVDGDLPIATRARLRLYFDEHVQQNRLAVDTRPGFDNIWSEADRLNLDYCVSADFGVDRPAIVSAMASAAATWEKAAYVKFHSVVPLFGCQTSTASMFVVKPTRFNTIFDFQAVASAFFPYDPVSQRYLLVDLINFQALGVPRGWTMPSVLTHELGHVLGFMHEHLGPEGGSCSTAVPLRALTPYDTMSIMEYPQCAGRTGDLTFSQQDRDAVGTLYGPWSDIAGGLPIDALPIGTNAIGAPLFACAFEDSHRDWHSGNLDYSPIPRVCRIGNGGLEQTSTSFKVLRGNARNFHWTPMTSTQAIPPDAVWSGRVGTSNLYTCRANNAAGKLFVSQGQTVCSIAAGGAEAIYTQFEVLRDRLASWRTNDRGLVASNALITGVVSSGKGIPPTCYSCNVDVLANGVLDTHAGKLCDLGGGYRCYVGFGGTEHAYDFYRTLLGSSTDYAWVASTSTTTPPASAVWGGWLNGQNDCYVCRVPQSRNKHPGKLCQSSGQWSCVIARKGAQETYATYDVLTKL